MKRFEADDPIQNFRKTAIAKKLLVKKDMDAMDKENAELITEAVAEAQAAPYLDTSALMEDYYCD